MGIAYAAKDAALSDAQDIADLLLDAEAKLGEVLVNITKGKPGGSQQRTTGGKMAGAKKSLPPNVTKKESPPCAGSGDESLCFTHQRSAQRPFYPHSILSPLGCGWVKAKAKKTLFAGRF